MHQESAVPASEHDAEEPSTPALLAAIDDAAPDLVESITERVQADIRAFAGPETGRRGRLIATATTAAIQRFLSAAGSRRTNPRKADDLFTQMGHGEALDGHDLVPIRDALRLAARMARDELHRVVVAQGASAATLRWLSELLDDEMDHLHDQVAQGHDTARRTLTTDPARLRRRVARMMLAGAPSPDIAQAAAAAGWVVPEELVVVAAESRSGAPLPQIAGLDLVSTTSKDAIVFVGSDSETARLVDQLNELGPRVRAATSWTVLLSDVPAADRWTARTLDLVRRRVLPDVPVTRCIDHQTQLWLHAEPVLRRRLVQELLPPLLAETPNSREILSETLLVWLQTRDSAPAIAATLGVHPQTVRYRWKRINDLFGDSLHDPEFVLQVTMLLKASVPLWKANDQSDFERFRSASQDTSP